MDETAAWLAEREAEKNVAFNNPAVNYGMNPLVGYNFMLRVEGLFDLPCKSVKAFTKENEYEFIQEGGINDYVHLKRKPISKPFTLTVERYVGVDFLDPLPNGAELILPVILLVSRKQGDFGVSVGRVFTFTACTVMGKTYGELSGESSGLLTETTTIAYREMLCVDTPWTMFMNQDKNEYKPGNIKDLEIGTDVKKYTKPGEEPKEE